jgi:hypothetical protein
MRKQEGNGPDWCPRVDNSRRDKGLVSVNPTEAEVGCGGCQHSSRWTATIELLDPVILHGTVPPYYFPAASGSWRLKKVDVRLACKGNSNSHDARPVHLIITMIQWIRTSSFSKKKFLSWRLTCATCAGISGGRR